MTRALKPAVWLGSKIPGKIHGLVNKAFGNNCYTHALSRCPGIAYQEVDLHESISRTEGNNRESSTKEDHSRGKHILVISQYFYPETFRINDMCQEWVKRGYKVTVVTGIPNYPVGKFFEGYGYTKKRRETWNGIDIIRIFDCLNDMRNLQTAVKAANKEKAHAQVALSYTLGDAYTLEYWVNIAKRIEEMGADSICIKDMAGLLLPYKATELVGALKDAVSIPIDLHTHYTSGVASMTYLKAVEAGVDIIDTAMSPFALGTSQPATEVMVETFKGTPYDTGFDQKLLAEIADYFRPIRDEALDSGLLNPKNLGVNIKTLLYQVPGGMLSNLTSQLKEQHAEDKFYDVLEEVPKVRKDLGEPPLVTPSSQIVGTQAVFNVLMGERYKMVTKETKDILLGKYGATVKPFNQEVQKKCIGDAKPITCRPADLLENEMDKLEKEVAPYKEQDEDVLSYALFPQVATDFFKYRQAQEKKVDEKAADTKNGAYPV